MFDKSFVFLKNPEQQGEQQIKLDTDKDKVKMIVSFAGAQFDQEIPNYLSIITILSKRRGDNIKISPEKIK